MRFVLEEFLSYIKNTLRKTKLVIDDNFHFWEHYRFKMWSMQNCIMGERDQLIAQPLADGGGVSIFKLLAEKKLHTWTNVNQHHI